MFQESNFIITNEDVHISYLPLAHMMERIVAAMILQSGGRIGFYRGDVKLLIEDIQALRPTIFVSVPRLLNRVYDKVPYSRKLSREKTFTNFTALEPSAKVFSVKFGCAMPTYYRF